jgi:hypothetical protein
MKGEANARTVYPVRRKTDYEPGERIMLQLFYEIIPARALQRENPSQKT